MAIYRLRQGARALFAFSRPVDDALIGRSLSSAQLTAFKRLHRGEQLHSLNVLRTVLAQGEITPPDLAVAALMHDLGKIRYPLRLWQKSIAVVVRSVAPPLFRLLSRQSPTHWYSRPFVVYVDHPAWSAEILAQTGASEGAIWLVAHHADPAEQWQKHDLFPLLQRLQAADDTN
jgi:hypothetical protein